ncbi:MAG: ABC transporter ATP-binding protein [Bacteroidales bacterium]|nr:ABC transporter ATP-binding protein [Bacteroidales bacterium]
MVSVDNIYFSYSEGTEVLHDVSFSARSGEVVSIVGRNGSGKSTLLKAISGDLALCSGRVCVGGDDVRGLSCRRIAQLVSFVEQDVPASDMKVRQYVSLGRTPWSSMWKLTYSKEDEEAVGEAMRVTGVDYLADKRLCDISGGERQLCSIARAVAQCSPVMLLDEPISNLDVVNQLQVLNVLSLLRAQGKTIICVLHDLNVVSALADKVVVLKKGRVLAFAEKADAMLSQVLTEAMDTEMKVVKSSNENMPIIVPENLLNICEKV